MAFACTNFDTNAVLTYLGLPLDYDPSPATAPVAFLTKHIRHLPSHILHWFSAITTPRQRTAVVLIRNRRFNFTQSNPPVFNFSMAKRQWPRIWEGTERIGREEAREEKEWVETTFLGGDRQTFVGNLGTLLGGYEEERHLEHERQTRRSRHHASIPEEHDEISDDGPQHGTPEPVQDMQESFLRRIRELFIYGHLEVLSIKRLQDNFDMFTYCTPPVGSLRHHRLG
jgi:hypothetical protein